jgi:RNA processing factor Prp31
MVGGQKIVIARPKIERWTTSGKRRLKIARLIAAKSSLAAKNAASAGTDTNPPKRSPLPRRGNPLKSYSPGLGRGMPGNEESDP